MLSFFRQKGLSNVLYGAIILATILTFVIEFRPNASQRTASLSEACAARVRGRCLDPRDFSSAYRILMPSRSAETSRRLNIKRVALDGLIERELLDDEARRLGISVTEDEVTDQLYSGFVRASVPSADPAVAQSILQEMYQSYARAGLVSQDVAMAHFNDRDTAIPVDFRDPKSKAFDMKVYERQVRNLSNRSTSEFRGEQARELLAAKMRDVIRAPIRVSETEAWQEYQRQYDTATLTWIPVKESWAGRWGGANASPADVEAWVKDHQKEFDEALADRQQADAPKAGHLRHILVKLPYGATDEEKAAGLAKLSWAVARVKAGEAFAEVARDVSDDTGSAAQGGDLGDKTDSFVPAFKAAADALAPGQTTAGAVETQFGYHFIMRDDPAKASEVAAQVKRGLGRSLYAKGTSTDAAKRIAGQIQAAIRAGKGADDAIRDAVSGFVRTGGKVERLRVLPGPAGDAGAPAPPRSTGDAGSSTTVGATTATPSAAPLPEKAFDASVDADRPQAQTSTAFNRGGDPFPGLSPDGTTSVVGFAFSAQDGDVMAEPVRTPDAYTVVQLKQHKAATRDEFDKNHETFVQGIVRTKRDEALSLYVKRLREQAKDDIKIDSSFVQEAKVDGGASSSGEDEDEY
jgi:peptidyl-prolyl cis-trans isomerase D